MSFCLPSFHSLQLSMLSILTKCVATLSEKKSADSLNSIEFVGADVMENLGNSLYTFSYVLHGFPTDCPKQFDLGFGLEIS